jgi:glutamyl-tRNA synthetase
MNESAAAFERRLQAFYAEAGSHSRWRLAPTPSGFLHAGNLYNFSLNVRGARWYEGGALLLRIDDLDADRKRPEYVQNIFDTLHREQIGWDEGPRDAADFEAHWSQQHRLPLYEALLTRLRARGLVYACAKSRKDLAPYQGAYPVVFREQGLDLDAPEVAWRVRTPDGFPLPDFIVRRRDGVPAYQVASIADDLHFGITHIIRGADLEASTLAQQWLAEAAGLSGFSRICFLHHPLILDAHGEKLSKSTQRNALEEPR